MKEFTNKQKIDEILTRGVGNFIDPEGSFRKKLEAKIEGKYPKDIVIKLGCDPTRPDLHLGHAVILHKLRQFQDLGCKVIFLIGDITSQIGDPTGKNKIRPEIDLQQIEKNMQTYLEQVGKILNTDQEVFDWTKNSDWFVSINDIIAPERSIEIKIGGEVIQTDVLAESDILNKSQWWIETRKQKNIIKNYTFLTLLSILRHISHGRLIERDMFQDRIKKGEPIFMHEILYPVIQGIDSDAIYDIYGSCDLEVGGTDQHFNMLVGREVMEMNQKDPQAVLTFKLLEGTDGKEKMSKSLDNYIAITDEPNDMYGKVMSIPDSLIGNYFELCTFTPIEEVENIRKNISNEILHPKEIKMNLAKQIVSIYHGEAKAQKAEENFINVFQKKEVPDEMDELDTKGEKSLMEILVEQKIISSKGDFRRLVEEGAVTDLSNGIKITNPNFIPKSGMKLKIGKRKFIKFK